jgi:hypothetical protein
MLFALADEVIEQVRQPQAGAIQPAKSLAAPTPAELRARGRAARGNVQDDIALAYAVLWLNCNIA